MNLTYRWYDCLTEKPDKLFELFATTYDDPEPLRKRWEWQYVQHPMAKDIKIIVAEDGDRLAGMTSFFPIPFLMNGELLNAWHGATAVVDPEYRRQGISTVMTKMFADELKFLVAKGVAEKQYLVIIKFGWQAIKPNTYMLKVLSIPRWLLRKARLSTRAGEFLGAADGFTEPFEEVQRFGPEFDKFWDRVAPKYPCIPVKSSAYMNWRYVDIPIKKYKCLYLRRNGDISGVIVLRAAGHLGNIVDVIWDPVNANQPEDTIDFTCRYLKKSGFTNSYCFATLKEFRETLKRHRFMELRDTPYLCAHGEKDLMAKMADGHAIHFVDGDSDHEFL